LYSPLGLHSQTVQEPGEYFVKAAFIYNFIKFIEWPAKSTDPTLKTFNIYILGDDPSAGAFESLNGKNAKGKTIYVKKVFSVNSLKDPHIIFVSQSEKYRIHRIVSLLKGIDVITVGDTVGYANKGVMINFFLENNKVRFEINIDMFKQKNMQVSSKLLSLAKIVSGKTPKEEE
jgi:hypothetical protein